MFWCSIWNASNTFWWEVGGNNRSKYCESVQMFLSFQFCANLIFFVGIFSFPTFGRPYPWKPDIGKHQIILRWKGVDEKSENWKRAMWNVMTLCVPQWGILTGTYLKRKCGKVGCCWCSGGGVWYKKGKENKILFYFRTQFEHNFITKSFQQIRLAMVDTGQVKINLDLPSL